MREDPWSVSPGRKSQTLIVSKPDAKPLFTVKLRLEWLGPWVEAITQRRVSLLIASEDVAKVRYSEECSRTVHGP
jgi:hypothetical protein